jgi:serine/threonine protein kinase
VSVAETRVGPGPDDTTKKLPDGAPPLPLPGAAPARLGPYRIERELARGGMGVVYVAEHEGLRRRVALKVMRAPR